MAAFRRDSGKGWERVRLGSSNYVVSPFGGPPSMQAKFNRERKMIRGSGGFLDSRLARR